MCTTAKKNWSIFRRSYQIDAKNRFTEYLSTKTQRPKLKCCYRNFHIRYSLYNLVQSGVTFISKSKYCHHTMNYGLKVSTWILLLLLNSSASSRYRVHCHSFRSFHFASLFLVSVNVSLDAWWINYLLLFCIPYFPYHSSYIFDMIKYLCIFFA